LLNIPLKLCVCVCKWFFFKSNLNSLNGMQCETFTSEDEGATSRGFT